MINFYFKIKHKTNYTEKIVCIVERDVFRAKKELCRCYPNWSEVSVDSKSTTYLESPTEKQLNYITCIEKRSGVKFNGQTKQEASEYIQENKGKHREVVLEDIYHFSQHWDLD